MTAGELFVVAATKSWYREVFDETISYYPGRWCFVSSPDQIDVSWVTSLSPRYIFFLHWSERVPSELLRRYECVCFHMTDVPYGRGGSPLQNLIARGHKTTKLTALRMTDEIDAGPVYMKRDLSLEGPAQEIYMRGAKLAASMIREIAEGRIVPQPQSGEPVIFRRRAPEQSEIPALRDAGALYDFIRMLDAETYPRAFIRRHEFRYEFSDAVREGDAVQARVTIRREKLCGEGS